MSAPDAAALPSVKETLRLQDRDRFLASLLLDPALRDDIIILYAFNAEIARIRDVVSEAIPGEIRLQWWRDAILGKSPEARAHPLASLLLDVIERHALSPERFDQILSARAFDLYHDPMPTVTDFETYAGETHSLIFYLSAEIASKTRDKALADAAGHCGVAYCWMSVLRNLGADAAKQQLFLPQDILAQFEGAESDLMAGKMSSTLREALYHIIALARQHRDQGLEAARCLPSEVKPMFLPIALVEPYLALIEKKMDMLLKQPLHLSQLKVQWALWRGGI